MQVFFVLLAGITLGPIDGTISLFSYLGLIGVGLPLDARSLGSAAFSGPTAGYLFAFPITAGVVGFLAAQQKSLALRFLAAMIGVGIIYLIGTTYLKFYLELSWKSAIAAGVTPFIAYDLAKAYAAAALGEGAREWWLRQFSAGRIS
jgi:biotin transport system substrate-specific component